MSGEVSYFSRFFVKFVEIIAAGLASAISAYLLAHFVSSPTPASPPTVTAVQVAPNASGVAAQPAPPAAAAAASEHPAPQDSPEAKLVPKTGRDAKVLPPRKHTKTDTSVAGKEPRNQKSAEEQVRAALANVDANRRVPADPAIRPDLTDTRSVPADDVPPGRPECRRNNPASYLGRSTFRPAALASRRQMRPTFCCSRSSLLRHRARTCGHVPRTSGPRRQVSARSRHNRCLRRTRTRTCFPPSSGSPICCAPTHRGQLASPRVRPCRSTRRRLNKSIRKTRTEAAFDNRVGRLTGIRY